MNMLRFMGVFAINPGKSSFYRREMELNGFVTEGILTIKCSIHAV
jgi:hypothetical protein